jgi:septal ring factor EnvC (AmiA/AmiB activator)
MSKQEQIANLKTTIAAVDSAIADTQAALQSPSTTADDIRALRATLIDLQAQRSGLMADLINLQASTTEVEAMPLTAAQAAEADSLHGDLHAAVADRSIVAATIARASAVGDKANKMRSLVMGAGTGPAAPAAGSKQKVENTRR